MKKTKGELDINNQIEAESTEESNYDQEFEEEIQTSNSESEDESKIEESEEEENEGQEEEGEQRQEDIYEESNENSNEISQSDEESDHLETNENETIQYQNNVTFKNLGVNSWLIDALYKMGIKAPTEIQANCIPEIMKGRDVVGGAKTGSGKTLAFALPMLHSLAIDPYGVHSLVLTPTRELAYQIAEQFAALGDSINLKYCVLVGGLDIVKQTLELSRRPHVIIATPGRLADVIRSSPDVIHLNKLKYLVLDEADRLLTQTFSKDLKEIFDMLPKQRQTLLFTATMTEAVSRLLQSKPGKEPPFTYLIKSDILTVEQLDQRYVFLPSYIKEPYLYHIVEELEKEPKGNVMIFVNKCYTAEMLKITLVKLGHPCLALHSMMPQKERLNALSRFKLGNVTTLISTDVGSRGLDIPSSKLVINYDVPRDPADYVHRVGRTARAGRKGKSITFISERDVTLVHGIEEKINKKMDLYEINEDTVLTLLNKVTEAKREATMLLHDTKFGEVRKRRELKYAAKESKRARN